MNDQIDSPFAGANPDVLTCIANLSERRGVHAAGIRQPHARTYAAPCGPADLMTARRSAADSTVKHFDPARTKSGVFLREITRRLIRRAGR